MVFTTRSGKRPFPLYGPGQFVKTGTPVALGEGPPGRLVSRISVAQGSPFEIVSGLIDSMVVLDYLLKLLARNPNRTFAKELIGHFSLLRTWYSIVEIGHDRVLNDIA